MNKIDTKVLNSPDYETKRDRAFRHGDITMPIHGHVVTVRHVEFSASGLLPRDDDPEREISIVLADFETGKGMQVLMTPQEALTFGQSLVKLADEEERKRIVAQATSVQ